MNETKPSKRIAVILLLIILAGGAALRLWRVDDPFGGYHSLNEAWYSATARNYEYNSFFNPTVSKGLVDYKVRPVYSYLAYLAMRVVGFNEAAPRLVSVVFSLAGLVCTYLIGCILATPAAGLLAAAFLAAGPAFTMLGNQAQPDTTYVTLTLASLWLYLVSRNHPRESALKAAAGIVWGIAIFTKNFAVLLLPGIAMAELLEARSLRWLNRRFFWFLLPAVVIPAPFLIYHFIAHPGAIPEIYQKTAPRFPDLKIGIYIAKEIIWAMSPFVCGLGVYGLVSSVVKKRKAGVWLASLGAPFLLLYLFLFVHSYYLLGFVPFLTLAAADGFAEGKTLRRWSPVLAAVLIISTFQTVATLASVKWEQTQFKQIGSDINRTGRPAAIVLSPDVSGSYISLFYYYLPGALVYYRDDMKKDSAGYALIPEDRRVYIVDFADKANATAGPNRKLYSHAVLGMTFAGKAIVWIPYGKHSFIPGAIRLIRAQDVGGPGVKPVAVAPSLIVTEMPEGYKLRHGNNRWQFELMER